MNSESSLWRVGWSTGRWRLPLETDVTGHNAQLSGALAAGMACEGWLTWLLADLLAPASGRLPSHSPSVA